MDDKYTVKTKSLACKGSVMDFYSCDVKLPDSRMAKWDLIRHPGGAAVLPIDEDGNFILVKQYRLGADKELLEIPAGKKDTEGEDLLTCVRRELKEETGYVSDNIEFLVDFFPAPAYSEEHTAIYVAKDLVYVNADPDDDEYVEIVKISTDKARQMILSSEIVDGKTIAAVMTYLNL